MISCHYRSLLLFILILWLLNPCITAADDPRHILSFHPHGTRIETFDKRLEIIRDDKIRRCGDLIVEMKKADQNGDNGERDAIWSALKKDCLCKEFAAVIDGFKDGNLKFSARLEKTFKGETQSPIVTFPTTYSYNLDDQELLQAIRKSEDISANTFQYVIELHTDILPKLQSEESKLEQEKKSNKNISDPWEVDQAFFRISRFNTLINQLNQYEIDYDRINNENLIYLGDKKMDSAEKVLPVGMLATIYEIYQRNSSYRIRLNMYYYDISDGINEASSYKGVFEGRWEGSLYDYSPVSAAAIYKLVQKRLQETKNPEKD